MQRPEPARLKPGVNDPGTGGRRNGGRRHQAGFPSPHPRQSADLLGSREPAGNQVRPKTGRDRYGSDKPAADCVSESLDTLDERWKAGSFRYLMPDFRARVHRGETFVIAGDRFAIGSSREMSPAGLKAVAEEVGPRAGNRLRREHGGYFSPQRVQPGPARRSESRGCVGGARRRRILVRPCHAPADQRDTGGDLRSGATEPEGRGYPAERRDIRCRPARVCAPRSRLARWSTGRTSRRRRALTTTEQIIWAHRVDKELRPEDLKPGTTLRVYADLLPASDGTAPFAIHTFNQITGGRTIFPRQAAIANDHFVFTGVDADEKQTAIGRAVRRACTASQSRTTPRPATASFTSTSPSRGSCCRVSSSRAPIRTAGLRRLWRGWNRRRLHDPGFRLGDWLRGTSRLPGRAGSSSRAAAALGRRQGHRPGASAQVGRGTVAGNVGRARRREPVSCRSCTETRSRT